MALFFTGSIFSMLSTKSRHGVKKRETENANMMQMFGSVCYLDNMLMKVCTF